jgi:hypothetical protein
MRAASECKARAAQTFRDVFVQPQQKKALEGERRKESSAQLRKIVGQAQDIVARVQRHRRKRRLRHITARGFDENYFIANHTFGVVQFVRERRFLVKHVRHFAEMFFAQTGLHDA